MLLLLTASASFLNANYCGNNNCNSCGGQNYQQNYSQNQYQQNYSQNQYRQNGQRNQPGYAQNKLGPAYQNGGTISYNDRQLANKIKDSLSSSFSKKYDNVTVVVNKGTVTLTGTVASQDDQKDLVDIVRDVPGVENINNQVKVQKNGQ